MLTSSDSTFPSPYNVPEHTCETVDVTSEFLLILNAGFDHTTERQSQVPGFKLQSV